MTSVVRDVLLRKQDDPVEWKYVAPISCLRSFTTHGRNWVPTFICDPELEERLRAERVLSGADRFDETWEGIYVMAPLANNEHQQIVSRLTSVFEQLVGWTQLGMVFPGVNISDRVDDWKTNYRCPDVAVFLKDTTAVNHDAFWYGGPDFAVEVVSEGDRTLEKLPFYAKVGTCELLIIHRHPWKLELYRLVNNSLVVTGTSASSDGQPIHSLVLDCDYQIVAGDNRPTILVTHSKSQQEWNV